MIIFSRQNQSMVSNQIIDLLTIQNVRKDLIGKIEAVIGYDNHIQETNDKVVINTLQKIKVKNWCILVNFWHY